MGCRTWVELAEPYDRRRVAPSRWHLTWWMLDLWQPSGERLAWLSVSLTQLARAGFDTIDALVDDIVQRRDGKIRTDHWLFRT